jgi:magnesium-dependent phosphatase 1
MKLPFDFARFRVLPKLIVFDLDHTLWPLGIDQFLFKPPYHRRYANLLRVSKDAPPSQTGPLFKVFDSEQKEMTSFSEVPEVLRIIKNDLNVPIGAASRTEYPAGANSLIDLFGWQDLFKYREIYPGSKVTHFGQFKQLTKASYDQMLFFDDEPRNIDDVSRLGVSCVLIDPSAGMTVRHLHEALQQFERRHDQ